MVECPNHGGAFDCSPFCFLCEGEQEITAPDLAEIQIARLAGDMYRAHTLAWGNEKVHEKVAEQLGLDFTELCQPWYAKWGRDALDGINPYVKGNGNNA